MKSDKNDKNVKKTSQSDIENVKNENIKKIENTISVKDAQEAKKKIMESVNRVRNYSRRMNNAYKNCIKLLDYVSKQKELIDDEKKSKKKCGNKAYSLFGR